MTPGDEAADAPSPRSAPSEDKPIVGATETVEVVGTDGSTSVVARSDTGATRTSIDAALAAAVGVGPISDVSRVKSASRRGSRARPVVELVVAVGGDSHAVAASVEDRSHMSYPLLLGRDVLEHYHVDARRRADEAHTGGGEE
ncbi:RimK/LysX family protein [Halobacteriaceae archaeon GCM10025711]